MMDVQEFKEETGVTERGVCVRARVLRNTRWNPPYFLFVDGQILGGRYLDEKRAYADAAIIRRAIKR